MHQLYANSIFLYCFSKKNLYSRGVMKMQEAQKKTKKWNPTEKDFFNFSKMSMFCLLLYFLGDLWRVKQRKEDRFSLNY